MMFYELKKNNYVIIKNKPCKIVDVKTSDTGKHGHAKKRVTGIDVITDKKYEDVFNHHSHLSEPIISKINYQITMIDDQNYLSLMDEEGYVREDYRLTHLDPKDEIKELYDDEEIINILMIRAEYKGEIYERIIEIKK